MFIEVPCRLYNASKEEKLKELTGNDNIQLERPIASMKFKKDAVVCYREDYDEDESDMCETCVYLLGGHSFNAIMPISEFEKLLNV